MWGIKVRVFASERLLTVDQINEETPQGSIFESTLFLIFINNIPDVISSQPGVYVDGTIIYSCSNSKPDMTDKIKMAAVLENDPQSVKWVRE